MTALLLITLSACSTKTITKTEYLTIPLELLQCKSIPRADISGKAYESSSNGDYKLLAIELVEDRKLIVEPIAKECELNARKAREYQESMIK